MIKSCIQTGGDYGNFVGAVLGSAAALSWDANLNSFTWRNLEGSE